MPMFNYIPDVKYDVKPVQYPFTQSDFVTAKNFFRRFELNPDVYNYALYYTKYAVLDGERIDNVAKKFYGRSSYDWIIVITNNIINPLTDWPMSDNAVRKFAEQKYNDPYSEILYYETEEVKTGSNLVGDLSSKKLPVIALEGGLKVSKKFYDSPFTYYDGTNNVTVLGSSVSKGVTAIDHELAMNEKKREIYILNGGFISGFIKEFKKKNLYSTKSTDFINSRLKKTGV
jgi:hypothetical protein